MYYFVPMTKENPETHTQIYTDELKARHENFLQWTILVSNIYFRYSLQKILLKDAKNMQLSHGSPFYKDLNTQIARPWVHQPWLSLQHTLTN